MAMGFPVLALLLVLGHCVSVQASLQACRKAARSSLDECACVEGCTAIPNEDGPGYQFVFSNSTKQGRSLVQQANCGGPYARITASNNRINYGTVKPFDIVHHLYDRCHENGCEETNPFSMDTNTLDGNGRNTQSGTVSVKGSGFYRSWDDRNGFVDLLAAAAGAGVDEEIRTPGADCRPGWDCEPQSIVQFQQYDFYQVDHWNDCGHQGQIQATVTVSTENKFGFLCEYAFYGAEAALDAVSAGAASLFGFLSLSCP